MAPTYNKYQQRIPALRAYIRTAKTLRLFGSRCGKR